VRGACSQGLVHGSAGGGGRGGDAARGPFSGRRRNARGRYVGTIAVSDVNFAVSCREVFGADNRASGTPKRLFRHGSALGHPEDVLNNADLPWCIRAAGP
jgi:hypothetical protein